MATVQDIEIKDTPSRIAAADAALSAARARSGSAEELSDVQGEKMVLNMGPSHPSTHGVLRIVLELDGEIITRAIPDVGYLHRGDEKIAENTDFRHLRPAALRL